MTIRIKTEKVVNKDGIPCRKIVNIEGVIQLKDLPQEYIGGFHFRGNSSQEIDFRNVPEKMGGDMYIGNTYPEQHFQTALTSMKVCGQRLHEINLKIAEAKKTWNGDETFII